MKPVTTRRRTKKEQEEAEQKSARAREILLLLSQLEKEKGVSMDVLISAIEEAVAIAYKKDMDRKADVRVGFDRQTGTMRLYRRYVVTDVVEEPSYEIDINVAQVQKPDVGIGDVVEREEDMVNFRRIATQQASQAIMQKLREAERDVALETLEKKQGEIVLGRVSRVTKDGLRVDLGNFDALLPRDQMVPFEHFRLNEEIRALVLEVNRRRRDGYAILSRRDANFVVKLFEAEIPEIRDHIIEIDQVVREPGYRTKIVVRSNDRNVEPVGACVGPKGNRIRLVVEKLRGEKIDVIKYSEEAMEFIAYALSPAPVISVEIYEEESLAIVVVPDDSYQLALGKNNVNVKLARELTGWNIKILKASQRHRREVVLNRLSEISPDQEMANLPVEELGLPGALLEILQGNGVDHLKDLLTFTWEELLEVPRLDAHGREVLVWMLRAYGMEAIRPEDAVVDPASLEETDNTESYNAAIEAYKVKAEQLAIGRLAMAAAPEATAEEAPAEVEAPADDAPAEAEGEEASAVEEAPAVSPEETEES